MDDGSPGLGPPQFPAPRFIPPPAQPRNLKEFLAHKALASVRPPILVLPTLNSADTSQNGRTESTRHVVQYNPLRSAGMLPHTDAPTGFEFVPTPSTARKGLSTALLQFVKHSELRCQLQQSAGVRGSRRSTRAEDILGETRKESQQPAAKKKVVKNTSRSKTAKKAPPPRILKKKLGGSGGGDMRVRAVAPVKRAERRATIERERGLEDEESAAAALEKVVSARGLAPKAVPRRGKELPDIEVKQPVETKGPKSKTQKVEKKVIERSPGRTERLAVKAPETVKKALVPLPLSLALAPAPVPEPAAMKNTEPRIIKSAIKHRNHGVKMPLYCLIGSIHEPDPSPSPERKPEPKEAPVSFSSLLGKLTMGTSKKRTLKVVDFRSPSPGYETSDKRFRLESARDVGDHRRERLGTEGKFEVRNTKDGCMGQTKEEWTNQGHTKKERARDDRTRDDHGREKRSAEEFTKPERPKKEPITLSRTRPPIVSYAHEDRFLDYGEDVLSKVAKDPAPRSPMPVIDRLAVTLRIPGGNSRSESSDGSESTRVPIPPHATPPNPPSSLYRPLKRPELPSSSRTRHHLPPPIAISPYRPTSLESTRAEERRPLHGPGDVRRNEADWSEWYRRTGGPIEDGRHPADRRDDRSGGWRSGDGRRPEGRHPEGRPYIWMGGDRRDRPAEDRRDRLADDRRSRDRRLGRFDGRDSYSGAFEPRMGTTSIHGSHPDRARQDGISPDRIGPDIRDVAPRVRYMGKRERHGGRLDQGLPR